MQLAQAIGVIYCEFAFVPLSQMRDSRQNDARSRALRVVIQLAVQISLITLLGSDEFEVKSMKIKSFRAFEELIERQ